MHGKRACDSNDSGDFKGSGWYRMMEPTGNKMPEQPPPTEHCETCATGWLNGTHPGQTGEKVTREVCFNYSGKKCKWRITIIKCNGFFIYNLPNSPVCNLIYCAH